MLTFFEACRIIAAECPNEYAKAYARAGMDLTGDRDAERTQGMYILSNLSHWRSPKATEVRAFLKEYVKNV